MNARLAVVCLVGTSVLGCSLAAGVGSRSTAAATSISAKTSPAAVTAPASAVPNTRLPETKPPPTPAPATLPGPDSGGPSISGCPVFPADHIWNAPIDALPVDTNSAAYIASIGADTPLHPDFGAGLYDGGPIGIPYITADAGTPLSVVSFDYSDESDPGPYPIPAGAPIEGGSQSNGDRHILIVDTGRCRLYELYAAYPNGDGSWRAGSGAIWDLRGYALRPASWTSADAAGLPILPGLARYDEIAAGEIRHALRFTAARTRNRFIWPARHAASEDSSPALPPLGQRFRLKPSFDLTGFPPQIKILLRAMQQYGLILADNGSNWFVSGAPDPRWDNDALVESFSKIKGGDFEAVDETGLMRAPDSGQVK
jgi:hypothetical protein